MIYSQEIKHLLVVRETVLCIWAVMPLPVNSMINIKSMLVDQLSWQWHSQHKNEDDDVDVDLGECK